jgi:hypothetical protein
LLLGLAVAAVLEALLDLQRRLMLFLVKLGNQLFHILLGLIFNDLVGVLRVLVPAIRKVLGTLGSRHIEFRSVVERAVLM